MAYDYTVRGGDGSVLQFAYGGDSVDPCKSYFPKNLDMMSSNIEQIKANCGWEKVSWFFCGHVENFDPKTFAFFVGYFLGTFLLLSCVYISYFLGVLITAIIFGEEVLLNL